jgi:hypothetical protein
LNSLPTLRDFIRAEIRAGRDVHEVVQGFSEDVDAKLRRFLSIFVEKMKDKSRQSKSHGQRGQTIGDCARTALLLSRRKEFGSFVDYALEWERLFANR